MATRTRTLSPDDVGEFIARARLRDQHQRLLEATETHLVAFQDEIRKRYRLPKLYALNLATGEASWETDTRRNGNG